MLNVLKTESPESRDLAQQPYKKFEAKSRSPSIIIIMFEHGTHYEHISINLLNLKSLLSLIMSAGNTFLALYPIQLVIKIYEDFIFAQFSLRKIVILDKLLQLCANKFKLRPKPDMDVLIRPKVMSTKYFVSFGISTIPYTKIVSEVLRIHGIIIPIPSMIMMFLIYFNSSDLWRRIFYFDDSNSILFYLECITFRFIFHE